MTATISEPLRSWLFTPATHPDRFKKAAEVGADVLIIDLEDAVAPEDKEHARVTALEFLAGAGDPDILHALRINGLNTVAGIADLNALLGSGARPDILVLPKAETAGHLQILDRLMSEAGKLTRLVAIIESARGLAAVETIAAATPRLAGLMLGAADMAADLGAETAWETLGHVRARIVVACALAGVMPVDSPFFDVGDGAALERETAAAIALGFAAKAAIHPAQVGPINAALSPGDAAVERARRILAENAKGVATVDGQMVDEAVARKARRILAAVGEQA